MMDNETRTPAEIKEQLAALRDVRAKGLHVVRYGEDEIRYRSDAELDAAIKDLERRLEGGPRRKLPAVINIRSKSGW